MRSYFSKYFQMCYQFDFLYNAVIFKFQPDQFLLQSYPNQIPSDQFTTKSIQRRSILTRTIPILINSNRIFFSPDQLQPKSIHDKIKSCRLTFIQSVLHVTFTKIHFCSEAVLDGVSFKLCSFWTSYYLCMASLFYRTRFFTSDELCRSDSFE